MEGWSFVPPQLHADSAHLGPNKALWLQTCGKPNVQTLIRLCRNQRGTTHTLQPEFIQPDSHTAFTDSDSDVWEVFPPPAPRTVHSLLHSVHFLGLAEFSLNFLLFLIHLHRSRVSLLSLLLPAGRLNRLPSDSGSLAVKQSLHITGCKLHHVSNVFHKWIFLSCLSVLQLAGRAEPPLDGYLGVAAAPHSCVLSSWRGMWGMQPACDNTAGPHAHCRDSQTVAQDPHSGHTVNLKGHQMMMMMMKHLHFTHSSS